jgi:hypothetical protein
MVNLNAKEQARYHAWFHHKEADGWVTIAQKTEEGFKQHHYRPQDLAEILSEMLGEDVYFSQNTFYKPQRRIENIRQLRCLYVDLDCYLLNYNPEWVIGKLDLEFFRDKLPEPNLIIFSGRGLVLVWLIDPAPFKALPLWQAIQNYFVKQLKEVGGDTKAVDPARIFRIAGSTNSRNGEQVTVQYRHEFRYSLRDIQQEYLPQLDPTKPKRKGRPSKLVHLHNIYRLHYARLQDLMKLVELRNYDVRGYRETICFLYRYWSCCILSDPEEALRHTLEVNSEFVDPLPEREVIRATRSAEKSWKAKNDKKANEVAIAKGYPGAGYNIKNSKIINWLDITVEEQKHLKTIIDGTEKRRRKRGRDKLRKREERGSVSREEYLEQQKDKTEDKLFLLQKAMGKYPDATQKELAEKLAVSYRHVKRLIKQLREDR